MIRKPRTVEEIIADPEYQRKRKEFEEARKPILEARDKDAQPLLDDLKKFNLHYKELWHLIQEPKNTFVLAIPRMVEYLDIFRDTANIETLANCLTRPEAKGFAAKPLIKLFRTAESRNLSYLTENTYFQLSKAINATAEHDDAEAIADLIFNSEEDGPTRAVLIRTLAKLKRCDAVPDLLKCLKLDEASVIEALKALGRYRSTAVDGEIRKLESHDSAKVRKLVQKILS